MEHTCAACLATIATKVTAVGCSVTDHHSTSQPTYLQTTPGGQVQVVQN